MHALPLIVIAGIGIGAAFVASLFVPLALRAGRAIQHRVERMERKLPAVARY